ncbi:hypothetical protein PORCAN_2116 [Porphyromonas crevioricanis JCM 13913]|nr:hypothetical protein PORCAN_2116 [Porphyromonas crevioricanis JCM 13913]
MTLSERPIHRCFDRGRKALKKSFFPIYHHDLLLCLIGRICANLGK